MIDPSITLTIVDEERDNAKRLLNKYNVAHRVDFTGKVDYSELVSLYSRKSILVMSSLYEGFGLPAAEAMACNTPVVATTAGALKEVVSDDTGILVPPGDAGALCRAIEKLLGDEKKEMGIKGRRRVEKYYAWPVAAACTLDVYQDVIDTYRSGL